MIGAVTAFSTMATFGTTVISSGVSMIPSDVWHFMGIYLFWSFAHVAASNFYSTYCAEWSLWGWFSGGIKAITPHCKAALWLQTSTSTGFGSWWITASTWLVTKINWITGNPTRIAK